ncbi:MAG: NrsF family protein [Methylocystis sp.]
MNTDNLIDALAADLTVSKFRFRQLFMGAMAVGAILAAIMFLSFIGIRPDFGQALATPRFPFKFVATLVLTITSTGLLWRLSRPGVSLGPWEWAWLAAPVLLVGAEMVELVVIPASNWWPRLIGTNAAFCLVLIPFLSIGPLACILMFLRQGAPTRPGLAGAVAGLVSGGVAATLYASHCIDDSPLFVATWYPMAIGIVALVGYLAGSRVLRW